MAGAGAPKDVDVIIAGAGIAGATLALALHQAGLKPVLMFSGIYPEAPRAVEVLTNRIRQAAAAGIPEVLTFGHTRGGNRALWVQRFKELGPVARDQGGQPAGIEPARLGGSAGALAGRQLGIDHVPGRRQVRVSRLPVALTKRSPAKYQMLHVRPGD